MRKQAGFFIFFQSLILLASCNSRDCENTSAIFNAFTHDSKEYRDELARQIQSIGADHLTYWLDGYTARADQELLQVRIQGEGLCAVGVLLVPDWHKLEGIRAKKGMGYHGAKLAGLRFDIEADSAGARLVYRDVERIVD